MATARFGPPEVVRPHVRRPRISALLDEAALRRVCLVVGAAGWGKTTALAAWSTARRAAWLRVGHPPERGGRLPGLLSLPAEGARADRFARAAHRTIAVLAAATGVSADEDVVLVLDDAHELHHRPAAAEFVEYLCQHGPDRLRIVLATRSEPPFSLARLRGRGEVGEIDATRLAFNEDDVALFTAAALGHAEPNLVRAIHEATDGWPAAVRLSVEGLAGVPPHRHLAQLDAANGPGGRLAAYLSEEVLGVESDDAGQSLRHLACLGAADAEALRATGISNPPLLLPDLARRGLAVHAAGPGGREGTDGPDGPNGPDDMWRAAEPLRRCAQVSPPLAYCNVVTIHRKAAASCAERGRYDTALTYLRAVGDHAAAAALLSEHGTEMINAGQIDAVLDAAADLPYGYLDDKVRQLVGYAKQLRGLWASADATSPRSTPTGRCPRWSGARACSRRCAASSARRWRSTGRPGWSGRTPRTRPSCCPGWPTRTG